MIVHLHKQQGEAANSFWQVIGLSKKDKCYEIHAWFELTEEERAILNNNSEFWDRTLLRYSFPGEDIELKYSVQSMTTPPKKSGEMGHVFITEQPDDLLDMENRLVELAKTLKRNIDAFKSAGTEGPARTR